MGIYSRQLWLLLSYIDHREMLTAEGCRKSQSQCLVNCPLSKHQQTLEQYVCVCVCVCVCVAVQNSLVI